MIEVVFWLELELSEHEWLADWILFDSLLFDTLDRLVIMPFEFDNEEMLEFELLITFWRWTSRPF